MGWCTPGMEFYPDATAQNGLMALTQAHETPVSQLEAPARWTPRCCCLWCCRCACLAGSALRHPPSKPGVCPAILLL
jgi:hypothetical protein